MITPTQTVSWVTGSGPIRITPTAPGDLLVAGIATNSEDGSVVQGVFGGGVPASGPGAWARAFSSGLNAANDEVSIWFGVVATAGSLQTVTLNVVPSLSPSFPNLGLYLSEFTESASGVWSTVTGNSLTGSGSSYLWPSLTAGPGPDQLYYAMGLGQANAQTIGQTPGFVLSLGAGANKPLLYNTALSPALAYQPSVPASAPGATTCAGVVFRGAGPPPPVVLPGTTVVYPDVEGDFKVWLQGHPLLSTLTGTRVFFRIPKDNPKPPFLRVYRAGGGPNPLEDTPIDSPRMSIEIWHTSVSGSPPPYLILRQVVQALQSALFLAQGVLLNPLGSTVLLSGSVVGVVDAPDPDLGWPRLVVDTVLNVRTLVSTTP
jgi:hypothetical protein